MKKVKSTVKAGAKTLRISTYRKPQAEGKSNGNTGEIGKENLFLEWKKESPTPVDQCEETLRHPGRPAAASGSLELESLPQDTISVHNSETLLLAEDDDLVRSLISLILKQQGYRVIEAVDGIQAVDKYIAHKTEISALVLDVILPKRSGKEVYDFIRKSMPDIRTLFISGYATETIEKKGVEGCYHLITKPFTPRVFLETVRKVLDWRSAC